MARPSRDVTDAELAVLEVLWELGETTIRVITDHLYPGGGTSHYSTVQKLLDRLQRKGWVRRRRGDGANVYRAMESRSELIDRQLRTTADKLCGGSLTSLLTHLVEGGIDAEGRKELRKLIDRMDLEARPEDGKEPS